MRIREISNEIMTEAKEIFDYVVSHKFCSINSTIRKLKESKIIRDCISDDGHASNFYRTSYRKELNKLIDIRKSQLPRYEFVSRTEKVIITESTAQKIVEKFEKDNFEGRVMTIEVKEAYQTLSKKIKAML